MKITDKAVEAAVNASGRRNNPKWDHPIFGYEQFSEDQKAFLRDQARAFLEAAAPFIAAEALDRAAEGVTRDVEAKQSGSTPNPLSWQTGALWVRDRLRMSVQTLDPQ